MDKKHIGSDFDEFLRSEGMLEEAEAIAAKRVIAFRIARRAPFGRKLKVELSA